MKQVKHNKELSPSIQILQHKLERSESQLSQMNKLRREAAELEVENTTLKKEKVSWYLCTFKHNVIISIFICIFKFIKFFFLQLQDESP